MSNVTYLPWVDPESLPLQGGDSGQPVVDVHGCEPVVVSDDVVTAVAPADVPADAFVIEMNDELQRLDTLIIRKLGGGDLSSGEVRALLIQNGLPELDAQRWVDRYEHLGYVNDERLAEALATAWSERKGKGKGAIAAEMRRRLINAEICVRVVADMDEDSETDKAIDIAVARARQLERYDRATAERRLVGFLSRRGFSGSIVRVAVRAALDSSV